MGDKPISFKDPLVLAIERGDKTVTRRLSDRYAVGDRLWVKQRLVRTIASGCSALLRQCVNHGACNANDGCIERGAYVAYGTDGSPVLRDGVGVWWDNAKDGEPWKPRVLGAMYCPRWASRLTLEVLDVRVERLREITDEDAIAEGVEPVRMTATAGEWAGYSLIAEPARDVFAALWDEINGKREGASWDANPLVRRIAFRRVPHV